MKVDYEFTFDNGRKESFCLTLRDADLALEPLSVPEGGEWMKLEYTQCEGCSLDPSRHSQCPVARNLAHVLLRFKDDISYDTVTVRVTTQNRITEKRGSLESCVSSIMGLIMATSGCPILDLLKPMAFTHLPFANENETLFRAVSMYLTAQYVRMAKGKSPNWDIANLAGIYAQINKLNSAFTERLRGMRGRDANVTALISLDLFAQFGTFSLPKTWVESVQGFFSAYLAE
jgi:hypothetical protein